MMGQMLPGWAPAAPKHTMQNTMPMVTALKPLKGFPIMALTKM